MSRPGTSLGGDHKASFSAAPFYKLCVLPQRMPFSSPESEPAEVDGHTCTLFVYSLGVWHLEMSRTRVVSADLASTSASSARRLRSLALTTSGTEGSCGQREHCTLSRTSPWAGRLPPFRTGLRACFPCPSAVRLGRHPPSTLRSHYVRIPGKPMILYLAWRKRV